MIRIKKLEGTTLKTESGRIQYLWAIIGLYNMTLIQVYSEKEPIDLVTAIKRNYERK